MLSILLIFLAYLFGSIPFGLIFAKTFCRIDPRTEGSGNVGATNVARLCGKFLGVATLICDVLKGAIPVYLAIKIASDSPLGYTLSLTLTALATVLGHRHSCFLGFKGGKTVATSVGIFLAAAFWQLIFAGTLCLFLIWRSEYVSIGSLSLVTTMPILLFISGRLEILPLALIIMLLVYWTHRDNILRLIRGEEKSWLIRY